MRAFLRRLVYFGIPLTMWILGSACAEPQPVPVPMATYRCARVGCDKIQNAPANATAPACPCGSATVPR